MENLSKAKGKLNRPVEYDGVDIKSFREALAHIKESVKDIGIKVETLTVMKAGSYYNKTDIGETASPDSAGNTWMRLNSSAKSQDLEKDITRSSSTTGEHGSTRGRQLGLEYIHIKIDDVNKVKERARELAFILKECGKLQTAIDKASDKALKAAQKISDANNSRQTIEDSKACAARMRNEVQQYYRAANTEASKLKAHASIG